MSVKEIKIINLEEVTSEEFAPYGQIWGREEGEPFETLEHLKYYSNNADLGPGVEKIDGGLLVCNKNGRIIEYLERQKKTIHYMIKVKMKNMIGLMRLWLLRSGRRLVRTCM
ncbi:MAG: hypothetical protein AMJ42_00005 [Deltaproteobacteria bacterium DG_8]|nr:MAG: hypothetical protein AMJ42_00005 [Deltaproteobacteria bacterium DG_8]